MPSYSIAAMKNVLSSALTLVALFGCATPEPASVSGYIIRQAQVAGAPNDETFNVRLGADMSRLVAQRAREVNGGATGENYISIEQEQAVILVEEELKRQRLCAHRVDVVRRLLHFDHNPDTEIVVRCSKEGQ